MNMFSRQASPYRGRVRSKEPSGEMASSDLTQILINTRCRAHRGELIGFAIGAWIGGIATCFLGIAAVQVFGSSDEALVFSYFGGVALMVALYMLRGTLVAIAVFMKNYRVRVCLQEQHKRRNVIQRKRIFGLQELVGALTAQLGESGEAGGDEGSSPPATYEGHGQVINLRKGPVVP
jgi:hypothetical protein